MPRAGRLAVRPFKRTRPLSATPSKEQAPQQCLSGWGRTAPSAATVIAPAETADVFAQAASLAPNTMDPPKLIARGLGRSYGDAAQCAGGMVVESSAMSWIGEIDPQSGLVDVGAGTSLDTLLQLALPSGWFVPVTPGTRQVTIGGAIAADVHGKNHHRDGSFCSHVERLTLQTPTGIYEVGPDAEADLFWATAGGMGLTGIITRARVKMRPVETAWMRVSTERHPHIDALMTALERVDSSHHYSVAWVDCATKGTGLGRGILDAGEHARAAELSAQRRRNLLVPPRPPRLRMPVVMPNRLLNRATVAAFNEAWFYKSPRSWQGFKHLSSFFHPLDAVANWNRLYGQRGFVQFQFVVPEAHRDLVPRSIELLGQRGAPCSLAVLKRFGPGDPGPLSFPMAGWTLALDLPVGPPGLPNALHALDAMVATAGGRVYLAKDARMEPQSFHAMYPRLAEFNVIRQRVDPNGLLESDLARRLGICEDATP